MVAATDNGEVASRGPPQNETFEPPDHLICSINREMFRYPFHTESGHTYERSAIIKWFERQKQQGVPLCDPNTNQRVSGKLYPSWGLRQAVESFLEDNSSFIPEGWESRDLPAFVEMKKLVMDGNVEEITPRTLSPHD